MSIKTRKYLTIFHPLRIGDSAVWDCRLPRRANAHAASGVRYQLPSGPMRSPHRQFQCAQVGCSAFSCSRNALGENPTLRRNSREKLVGSEKPSTSDISLMVMLV